MKKQKLQQLLLSQLDKNQFNKWDRKILNDVETLQDFKDTMIWYSNMLICLRSQINSCFKWHQGTPYAHPADDIQCMFDSVDKLCSYMGYEIDYNENGFAYIKTK